MHQIFDESLGMGNEYRNKIFVQLTKKAQNDSFVALDRTLSLLGEHVCNWILNYKELKVYIKEYELLKTLISYPGKILTQQQLLRDIWGAHHTEDTHYLRVVIGRLRNKLEDDPTNPHYIETLAGVGYRFIGVENSSAIN